MKIKLIYFLLLVSLQISAQAPIELKSSKVHGLFNFMETMKGWPGTSRTLLAYGEKNIPKSNAEFYDAIAQFTAIELDYSAKREEYPADRHQYVSTRDLIIMASVQADDLDEFNRLITGYLPHIDQYKLLESMKVIEPFYEQILWSKHQESTEAILGQIEAYKTQIQDLFARTKIFYGSFWSDDFPFVVSLYPIPGKRGYTTATPHNNVLVGGFMTDHPKDFEGRLGVIIHEMCHVIYACLLYTSPSPRDS